MSTHTHCDQCGNVASDNDSWCTLERRNTEVLGSPSSLDFCNWNCLAAYLVATAKKKLTSPAPTNLAPYWTDIRGCARCGRDHEDIRFSPFDSPVEGDSHITHFAVCPVNEQPILGRLAYSDDLLPGWNTGEGYREEPKQ